MAGAPLAGAGPWGGEAGNSHPVRHRPRTNRADTAPGCPGRSYSGALHLDTQHHARSTYVWADGRRDGSGTVECSGADREALKAYTEAIVTRHHVAMVPVDDEYLIQVGRLAYSVAYLEWVVLGEFSYVIDLPIELELRGLVGKTTGALGKILQNPSVLEQVAESSTRQWLQRSGELLASSAILRNSVLHARPATIGGHQRLYRWHPNIGEAFSIDPAWIGEAQRQIDEAIREVSSGRPRLNHPAIPRQTHEQQRPSEEDLGSP